MLKKGFCILCVCRKACTHHIGFYKPGTKKSVIFYHISVIYALTETKKIDIIMMNKYELNIS